MNESVVVVAVLHPATGKQQEAISVIAASIPTVHAEPGCELYALNEGNDELVMVEKWSSQQAFDAHIGGSALKALGAALAPLVSRRPDVRILVPRPAGDGARGSV